MPKQITYKEANSMLFSGSRKDTHTFLGGIGACWKTKKLREVMRKSQLYFAEEYIFGGHRVAMQTPEGRIYRLETDSKKVKKYEERLS